MSQKNLDSKGRWRNRTVSFRVSEEENNLINEAVKLSGKTKQEYITSKLLDREVVVMKSPKTFKALKDTMKEIIERLNLIGKSSDFNDDLHETIKFVTKIYMETKA